MHKKKFLFVGTRFGVLEFMLQSNLEVSPLLPIDTKVPSKISHFQTFDSKQDLIKKISQEQFDILISNGCPFILPIQTIAKPNQIFVNIHPSLLPALKGPHPINGAILENISTGATCHLMNDLIDGGEIITQVKIHNTPKIHLKLLYQLCFLAEKEAFKQALERKFLPSNLSPIYKESYFIRTHQTMMIDFFCMTDEEIIKKTRAFCIKGQYAKFIFEGNMHCIKETQIINNSFLKKRFCDSQYNEILLIYEDCILIARGEKFLEITLEKPHPSFQTRKILGIPQIIFQSQSYAFATQKEGDRYFSFLHQSQKKYFTNFSIQSPIPNTPYFDLSSAYGFGGYLCNTQDSSFIQEALKMQEISLKKQNVVAEFIRFHPLVTNPQIFAPFLDFFTQERQVVIVNTNKAKRWEHYSPRLKTKIKKALKELKVRPSQNIHTFHRLYTETMLRNQAQDFYFFDLQYFQHLAKLNHFIMLEAIYQDQICAMAIFLYDQYTSYYHLGANSHFAIHKNINPMCAIFETFFELANMLQIPSCILGGGRSSDENDTLLAFKKQFSPIFKPFYIGGKIYHHQAYNELCKSYNNPYFLKYRFEPLGGGDIEKI